MMGKMAMPNDGPGEGERAGKARRNRISAVIALLMLAGGIMGFLTTIFSKDREAGFLQGNLPAWAAILSAIVLVVALTWGSWKFFDMVDEVERRDNYFANTIGLYAYMTVYSVWYLLWKGQIVAEPGHQWIFACTFIAMIAAYLWKKWRP